MKLTKIISLAFIPLFLGGCWDKVEIDRKSFISTIAIDVSENIGKEEELKKINPSDEFQSKGVNKLKITFGFPDISELGVNKGSSAKEKFITTECYSMQNGIVNMASRTSRSIYTSHTKLLIISSDLLHYPETFKEVMDYFQRNPNINKKMKVVVANGESKNYVSYEPLMEKNIESYINGLTENSNRNASILPMTLNELLILLNQNGNAIIPSIDYDKLEDQVFLSGLAMIKDFEMVGSLDPIETSGLAILRGKMKGGNKVVFIDGNPVDFEIDGINRKVSIVEINDDSFKAKINIVLEGQLKNFQMGKSVIEKGTIKQIEGNFNSSIEKECEKIARITQENFSIDPIGIREMIKKYHPKEWKKIEKNWDEVYKNSIIDISVATNIRRYGIIK
ncbi:Ger(x)C family spore germination protein [Clostridium grantii]|uniref:Germination protein, Ger(X)C family n=1 Tax=Clostridium grantii DSM 8605 TaxID=1121316 RepID=A0A1M5TKL7_9CLOT|nr:Ger(x)C family spore germination protein [Clostridium grantii]SHH51322.1 germination protein, Ger(x)C family [Clostridium grantii DSM 8605]